MNLHIKQIRIEDPEYKEMVAFRNEILRKPLGRSIYDDDLSKDIPDIKLIAVQEDKIVGCLILKKLSDDLVKLRAMAVDASLRKAGIGRMLVKEAEKIAVAAGYKDMEMFARVPAVGFYEKLGYTVIGDEFLEVGIPHLLMKKNLA